MALKNIDAGQTGAVVREILNSAIGEVEKNANNIVKTTGDVNSVTNDVAKVSNSVTVVSGEVKKISDELKGTVPLTNAEIESIFSH